MYTSYVSEKGENLMDITESLQQQGERLEELRPGGYRILQKEQGFHYTMDAVLLADFARIRSGDTVADFGTGTGIIPLLLLERGKGKAFHAFELQPEMAEMASRTMQMNGLQDVVQVHPLPVEQAETVLPRCSLDAIVCNPPYGAFGTTLLNPEDNQRVSRHQNADGLAAWLRVAFLLLKGKGRISLVYPAAQMLQLMDALQAAHLQPKRFRLVYPLPDRAPNLVLVDAIKDGRPMLQPEPPLIVHHTDGTETEEIRRIYQWEEKHV